MMSITLHVIYIYTLVPSVLQLSMKKWPVYIDSSMYSSLISNNQLERNALQYSMTAIYLTSKEFFTRTRRNYAKQSTLKSIIGRIKCCPFNTDNGIYVHNHWRFECILDLSLNVTFLYTKFGKSVHDFFSKRIPHGKENTGEHIIFTYFNKRYRTCYQGIKNLHWKKYHRILGIIGRRDYFNLYFPHNVTIDSHTYLSTESKFEVLFSVTPSLCVNQNCKISRNLISYRIRKHKRKPIVSYYDLSCYTAHRKISTFYINIVKTHKIVLNMSNSKYHDVTFRIFDGPDTRNRLMKVNKKVFLSSFFCYFEVDSFQNTTFHYSVRFSMQLGTVKKYHIQNKRIVSFTQDMCKTQYLMHCIFDISTIPRSPNVSVVHMRYSGPDYDKCRFGGVSIQHPKINERTMCDNYTKNPKRNSFEMVPMDSVGSEHHVIIVIYAYAPYHLTFTVTITVSASHCKGFTPCDYGEYQHVALSIHIDSYEL